MQHGVYTKLEPTGKTKVAYGNEAIAPNFKFDYYDENGNLMRNGIKTEESKPIKTEIYKADSKGNYYLSKVINYNEGK